eukprot:gene14796-19881_t
MERSHFLYLLSYILLGPFINHTVSISDLSSNKEAWLIDRDTFHKPFVYEWDNNNNSFIKKLADLPAGSPSLDPNFPSSPCPYAFKSHSQTNQDMIVLRILNDKSNGYFIDLAANDWQLCSNSFIFDMYNHWGGVCIEPNPKYHPGLLGNRHCNIFINPVSIKNGDTVDFNFEAGPLGGIVNEEFDNKPNAYSTNITKLHTVTITTILDEVKAPNIIDYFSLDVEGAELFVLKGFDFEKYKFMVLTIERPKEHVHHLLTRHGMRFVAVISEYGEVLYIHHTLSSFAKTMNEYYSGNDGWYKQPHPYLLHPPWNGTYYPISYQSNAN